MKPSIILADDHQIIREGIKTMIQKKNCGEVIAEAANGKLALQLVRELNPAIVMMDVSMPDMNGVEATKHILAERPQTKVIALSMHNDKQRVLEMLSAGATGYLLKDCSFNDIEHAIDAVLLGKIFVSPTIGGDILRESLEQLNVNKEHPKSPLTTAEREVLQQIAEGKSNKAIAEFMSVSVKTIETHRQHLMDKLNLHTVAELTKYAVREGITFL
jgi:DNA-binding NarL/FixJ family response regulator